MNKAKGHILYDFIPISWESARGKSRDGEEVSVCLGLEGQGGWGEAKICGLLTEVTNEV